MYSSDFKIDDVKIGHYSNKAQTTGTTVILSEKGAVIGASVRGAAPGTRETDLADPKNSVEKAHAVFLTGGSAFGLDCAAGIMQYLEERKIGFDTSFAYVPIVLGAVIFDLGYKDSKIRPDKSYGYKACKNAAVNNNAQGNIGGGTGATCGKIFGMDKSEKSGLGIATIKLDDDVYVTAIFTANPFGDIYNADKNEIIGGQKSPNTIGVLLSNNINTQPNLGENTTIGAIITNAKLTKSQANKVADIAHDGIALGVRPCHTMFDGDTIFALSTCQYDCDINRVLVAAVKATSMAISNSIYSIKGTY